MSKIRRPLTRDEWEEVGKCHREAIAALSRIGNALLHTEPVRVYDRWAKIRHHLEWKGMRLVDLAFDHFGANSRADKLFERDPKRGDNERSSYGWPAPSSVRKRKLTRQEWVVVGDDVKHLVGSISRLETILQALMSKEDRKPWNGCLSRVKALKSRLDGTVCKQHPYWPEATRVFYGDPSQDNPLLLQSLAEKARAV